MYLGKNYLDVIDNLKPLFENIESDMVIVARNKKLFLLTLKEAAFIKHHVAKITMFELYNGLSELRRSQIYFGIKRLYEKGAL